MHKIVPNLLRYETGIFEALFVFIFEEGNTKQFKNQIEFFRVDIVLLSLPSKLGIKATFWVTNNAYQGKIYENIS